MSYLGELLRGALSAVLRSGARSAVLLMLLALFCGALDGLGSAAGEGGARFVPYAAILGASLIAAGDLSVLIGLGAQTAEELGALSKLLLRRSPQRSRPVALWEPQAHGRSGR